jgi:glutamyl-tRNA reductase
VEESSAGPVLRRLFDQAVSCGRRVRTETEIARGAVSVSHMAVELARQIFGKLQGKSVLLLGAGEMAELTARQMSKYGVSLIMVANRTFERAEALATSLGGQAVKYDDFPERMANADIVVSSTAAPHAVILPDAVRAAAARRRGRPMFFIDLAVPRDIDPGVGDLDNVFLYNLDDLQVLVGENLEGRRMELEAVQDIIDEEVATFMRWTASLQTVPVLHELQQRFEAIREAEWERTERRLRNLSPAERDAVEQMTRAMVKKMLHEPWRYLRANSGSVEAAAALQSLIDVFDLEASQPPALCESEPAPLRPPVPAPRRSAPGTLEGA